MVEPGYNDDVSSTVALVVDRLLEQLGESVERIQRRITADIDELRGDPRLVELLRFSVAGNVETVLTVIRYGIDLDRAEPPTAALEYARRAAQHGIPVSALIRAYRLGQQEMLERILEEIRRSVADPDLRLAVYDRISATSFAYIDWISQQVSDTYEVERERWLEHRNSMRAVRVREMLADDAPVDVDAASAAVGYPLRGGHLALVLWTGPGDPPGGELLRLERFTRAAAEALRLRHRPLFVAEDTVSGWAWLPVDRGTADPAGTIRELAETEWPDVFLALGVPDTGLAGFRRSHRRARAARKVATAAGAAPRVVAADDRGDALCGVALPARRCR